MCKMRSIAAWPNAFHRCPDLCHTTNHCYCIRKRDFSSFPPTSSLTANGKSNTKNTHTIVNCGLQLALLMASIKLFFESYFLRSKTFNSTFCSPFRFSSAHSFPAFETTCYIIKRIRSVNVIIATETEMVYLKVERGTWQLPNYIMRWHDDVAHVS